MEGDYDQGPWLGAAFVSNGIKVGLSDIGLEYPRNPSSHAQAIRRLIGKCECGDLGD